MQITLFLLCWATYNRLWNTRTFITTCCFLLITNCVIHPFFSMFFFSLIDPMCCFYSNQKWNICCDNSIALGFVISFFISCCISFTSYRIKHYSKCKIKILSKYTHFLVFNYTLLFLFICVLKKSLNEKKFKTTLDRINKNAYATLTNYDKQTKVKDNILFTRDRCYFWFRWIAQRFMPSTPHEMHLAYLPVIYKSFST